jgi:hypothetical protein
VTIKILTATGPSFGEPDGLSFDVQQRITSSLEYSGARLLRVWETPSEFDVSDAGLFVIRDPPAPHITVELLGNHGLRLVDEVSVVPLAPSADAQGDLDAIARRLPAEFPEALLRAPRPDSGEMAEVILGLAMCPSCGGWGGHVDADCPRA